jgi:hypothetical protein
VEDLPNFGMFYGPNTNLGEEYTVSDNTIV